MANTNMDALYPEFWFGAFDKLDMGILNLQNLVSRDVEKDLADRGEMINVPITPDLGEADDWVPGTTITATGITQRTVAVALTQSKRKTINLNDKERSLSPYRLIEVYGEPQAKAILDVVNKDIYRELLQTNNIVAGAITQDKVTDAKVVLDNLRVGSNRFMVMDGTDLGILAKESKKANEYGSNQALREGLVDRLSGFDIYQNAMIEKYTPADLTGAVNHPTAGSYAAGTTTIAVDGFADAAAPLKAGVAFTIADDTTKYVITDTTQDTDGNTTGITFYPASPGVIANDKAITPTATKAAIGFVPSAVAFAARAYSMDDAPGIRKSVTIINGLPIRVMVWSDSGTTNVNVQFDILYGVQMINPNRVVRIDS